VTALVTGLLLGHQAASAGRDALAGVFLWGPLLFLANAAVALFVPDRKNAPAALISGGAFSAPATLRPFLIAFFLYQFAMGGMLAFLSLHLGALGAAPGFIPFVWAAGVVFEVLMMTRIGRWSDQWGRRPALAIAFAALPVRLLLLAVAPGPLFVLGAQALEGLNFGIVGAISIAFVNDLATDKNRGAAQARLAGVSGLAFALGPVAGGLVAGAAGYRVTFVVLAGVAIAGAFLFLRRVGESHPAARPLSSGDPAPLRLLLRLLAAPPPPR
jgi:MFS family permease